MKRRRVFGVLFFSLFISMLGIGIIIPLLPIYATELGANGVWVGLIFSSFSISRSVFSPVIGRFSDRFGRKKFITVGLFLYWVVSLAYLVSRKVTDLVLIRLIQGFSATMILPIAMAYIGEIAPQRKEGSYIGGFSVALFAGFGIGPLLGGLVTDRYGINGAFVVMSTLCFLAFLMSWWFLPELNLYKKSGGALKASYLYMLRSPIIAGIFSFRFGFAFSRGVLITFLPLYADAVLGLTSYQIGVMISATVLLTSLLQAPSGKLADKFSRRGLTMGGTILFVASLAAIPHVRLFSHLLLLSGVIGCASALPLPAASAMMIEEGRRFGMGATMGLFNFAMSLGMAAGPVTCGIIKDLFSLSATFYTSSAVSLAGAFLFLSFSRQRFRPSDRRDSLLDSKGLNGRQEP